MKRVTLGFIMTLVAAVFIAGPAFASDDYPPQPEVVVSPTEVVAPPYAAEEERPSGGAAAEEELAVTGFDVTTGMLAGAGLLGAGGVALISARRKSRA
jgi:LPXTG-motif cell wall-anchored protein